MRITRNPELPNKFRDAKPGQVVRTKHLYALVISDGAVWCTEPETEINAIELDEQLHPIHIDWSEAVQILFAEMVING